MESIAPLAASSASLLGFFPAGGAAQAMCLALLAVAGIMTLERLVIVVPSAALLTGLGALAAEGWVDPLAGYGASVAGSIVGACAWHAGGSRLRHAAGTRILPPCGEGGSGRHQPTPTPDPSPQGGGETVAPVASLEILWGTDRKNRVDRITCRLRDALAPGSPGLGLAIALAQCVPTVRLLAPMAAGLGGVRLLSSTPFVAVGCAVWNGAFFLIGYRLAAL